MDHPVIGILYPGLHADGLGSVLNNTVIILLPAKDRQQFPGNVHEDLIVMRGIRNCPGSEFPFACLKQAAAVKVICLLQDLQPFYGVRQVFRPFIQPIQFMLRKSFDFWFRHYQRVHSLHSSQKETVTSPSPSTSRSSSFVT